MNPTISDEARQAASEEITAACTFYDAADVKEKGHHVQQLLNNATEELRKDRDDITAAIEQCFGERPINGMSHAEAIRQVIAERDQLRSENITFRNAQKACETCDGPTMEEFKRLQASCAAKTEALRELATTITLPAAKRSANGNIVAQYGQVVKNIADAALADTSGSELLEKLAALEKERDALRNSKEAV